MELSNDFSNLPTSSESERDCNVDHAADHRDVKAHQASEHTERHEQKGPRYPYLPVWGKKQYYKALKLYHYDSILLLKRQIAQCEARLSQVAKDPNAKPCDGRYPESKKQRLTRLLQQFEEGWAKIARVLRPESRKLFVLPRELRDQIYGHLYTRATRVQLVTPYKDARGNVPPPLPRDPFFYLNASIVDPAIAAEAARVLYATNTFDISERYGYFDGFPDYISDFLQTDHFGSGVVPRDMIRRLHFTFPTGKAPPSLSLQEFEHARYDDGIRCRDHPYSMRMRFARLLEMKRLKVVTAEFRQSAYCADFRDVLPVLAMLRDRGVSIEVEAAESPRLGGSEPEDVALRVMLDEHYSVFLEAEWLAKRRALVNAKANIDAIRAALQV